MTPLPGHVYLVGAGPGDPDLITAGGLELLRLADVVVHDRLIGPELLWEIRPDAELIDAGKAPHNHTLTQERINAALVEHAKNGRSVVRLKGGDSFVYGRGFEEIEACRAAGVPVHVLPGVSSALAAPAAAGIPVTHRGVARTLTIATPQTGAAEALNDLDYAALAAADTLVLLMARAALREVSRKLIAAGRSETTPAAVVADATLAGQRVATGTLATIADAADATGVSNPCVIVIGETAAHATDAAPAQIGPLAGKKIVVTRPLTASARLVKLLTARGATAIECPLIRIEYRDPDAWPADASDYDWAVFTSLHAVRGFWRTVRKHGRDARFLGCSKIAAVGPKTAAELLRVGLVPDLVPTEFRAATLIREMAEQVGGGRVFFPCGTLARDELTLGLRAAGAIVDEFRVYDTLPTPPTGRARDAIARGVDAVLLYSPSGVRSLVDGSVDLKNAAVACIGPTTADAARAAGYRVDVVPEEYSDDGMMRALEVHLET